MKLKGPDEYHVTIRNRSASIKGLDGTPHFVTPATAKNKPKLYVASKGSILLYIGVTTQPTEPTATTATGGGGGIPPFAFRSGILMLMGRLSSAWKLSKRKQFSNTAEGRGNGPHARRKYISILHGCTIESGRQR